MSLSGKRHYLGMTLVVEEVILVKLTVLVACQFIFLALWGLAFHMTRCNRLFCVFLELLLREIRAALS